MLLIVGSSVTSYPSRGASNRLMNGKKVAMVMAEEVNKPPP